MMPKENMDECVAQSIYKKLLDAKSAARGDDDGRKHITEAEMLAALEAFIGKPTADKSGNVTWNGGNEYWRDLFMEAPTGARLRLALNFYFTENREKSDFPMLEYRALRKAVEDAMDFDSLEYLIVNDSNEAAKKRYMNIWKARMDLKKGKDKDDGMEAMSERDRKLAARTDEEWFKLMHRCGTITSKAACGTCYKRVTGKWFPMEAYHKWEAYVLMQDADWDYIIKHIHSYARGMPVAMARRHYQHKDIRGNPIEE